MRPSLIYKKKRSRKTRPKQTPEYRAKASAEFKRAYERLFGSQGAASPIRKIDPATGEVIAIIKPD